MLIAATALLCANVVGVELRAPVDVQASELVASYRADDATLRGESVIVRGTVTRMGASALAYVVVGGVHCTVDDVTDLGDLSVGDAVRVHGVAGGYILGSPMIDHCKITR
jgi:hypothetical protein